MPTALLCGFVVVCACFWTPNLIGQEVESGSGKRQYQTQALQSIPFHQLNQATKDKLNGVLQKPSIYRRLPVTTINSDPDYFRFLVRYPEVIVDIWQLMGVTRMSTRRTGPYTIDADDGVGTLSSLELVYGNDNMHIFYGTGSYEGPVLRKKLYGSCVLILQTGFGPGPDGKPIATNQLDIFLKVENAALGLIAKTIQPIVGTTADHNFVESLKFVQRLNETTERNGPGVQRMANRLDIDQDVRQKFIDAVATVYARSEAKFSVPNQLGADMDMSRHPNGQQLIQHQESKLVPSPATYQTNRPDSLSGEPLSSLNPFVPSMGRPGLEPSGSYPPGMNSCLPCAEPTPGNTAGNTATQQAASRALPSRGYGFQAPAYSPIYQGQGAEQPPIAYQAQAFGSSAYPVPRQDWRR